MPLPSQTDERARLRRDVAEDVAERDEVRREVRHLDADRLLAGDRREDADLGRRERVGEVVAELGDLADLRARGELELVAGDARARDLPDHGRLDAEVREADAGARRRSARLASAFGPLPGAELFRSARSGRRYSETGSGADVEERLLGVLGLLVGVVAEARRRERRRGAATRSG